jgi:hypothetical protein
MAVSLDDFEVVNINLLSERQNTLIFGGLLFLSGIVLYALFKIKQTKEEEVAAEINFKETRIKIILRLNNIFPSLNRIYSKFRSLFVTASEGPKKIFIKFLIGLSVGFLTGTHLSFLLYRLFRYNDYFDWNISVVFNLVDGVHYVGLIFIIILALTKGTIIHSFKLTLKVGLPIIIVAWIVRIIQFKEEYELIHSFFRSVFTTLKIY